MIIRSLCRRSVLAGPFAANPAARCIAPQISRRAIHLPPKLEDDQRLVTEGIPGLLSPAAFKTAWTDYMKWLGEELNASIAGRPEQNAQVKDLIVRYARDPENAYEFNLASMAYNNHFFFRGIHKDPTKNSRPSASLHLALNTQFSSLPTFREDFLTTAETMFGPGFVWLVQNNINKKLFILPTYLAGSPLPGAHYRRQTTDMNTHPQDQQPVFNSVGAFGKESAREKGKSRPAFGGVEVTPLLCVSTWEHVWLQDYALEYGFGMGKRRYLEAWWKRINWNEVENLASLSKGPSTQDTFVY